MIIIINHNNNKNNDNDNAVVNNNNNDMYGDDDQTRLKLYRFFSLDSFIKFELKFKSDGGLDHLIS